MLSPNKPVVAPPTVPQLRTGGLSGAHIAVAAVAFTVLISVPICTHPLPPLSDYINHLARMKAIATLSHDPHLANFYEIDWKVIPNLIMDLIVPPLAREMNIYLAGQIFVVAMFALIVSGTLALNRALIGRWSTMPLLAIPLLYNYVFLVGLMNYIFGIGVALWALAGWIVVRERARPVRMLLSTASVVVLFFCHLSALGIYGIGVLSFELLRLWEQRGELWCGRVVDFVAGGLPFLAAAPLLYVGPTKDLVGSVLWEQRGKIDGLMYVIADYSDLVAFTFIAIVTGSMVWALRRRVLRFHPLVFALMVVGAAVYFALPRMMFDTDMADQRVPLGIAFMLLACGDLELRRRLVRRGFMAILIVLVSMRLAEIEYNWSQLSDSTGEFRSSVRHIAPGSKVFVAYADRPLGDGVQDLGLWHAACIAIIERSALVTTVFTVAGKQVMHVKPAYYDYVDRDDGTPPSITQLLEAASHPLPGTPKFWINWTRFDYLYVLFTEDGAPNPDPSRLQLVVAGDRFQLYKIIRPKYASGTP